MSRLQIRCWMLVIRTLIAFFAFDDKLSVTDSNLFQAINELYKDLSVEYLKDVR